MQISCVYKKLHYSLRMMSHSSIPTTYAQWKHCITVKCGIQLTRPYVTARIATLSEQNSAENRSFRSLYGEQHYQSVKRWFAQALEELDRSAS